MSGQLQVLNDNELVETLLTLYITHKMPPDDVSNSYFAQNAAFLTK